MQSFSEIGLPDQILENLKGMKYEKPTEVQAATIPVILDKKDVVIQSHTGSGKTAAFGLPILKNVMTDVPAVQFLILVPTRELAAQVRDELESIAKDTEIQVCAIYGGADMNQQIQKLRKGAQVVVGTPGRILDHLKRRTMSFSVVRGVVLDESDKMLSMGFLPDVQLIFKFLPKRRQMMMSSATFPYTIQQLIHQYMIDPVELLLSSDDIAPKEIDHLYCSVQNHEKEQVLLALVEKEQPELSLVFCNTKIEVKSVHMLMSNAGLKVEGLSSDLTQSQREQVLRKLKMGEIQHMVCTDLAARGIDIPALTHVFNFSSSGDSETYVHRAGRTGRAGKSGVVISLVATLDLAGFLTAMKVNEIEAREIQAPTEEEIVEARVKRHHEHLKLIDFARETDVREEFTRLAEMLTPEQAASMLPLLLEYFRKPRVVLPAPPPPAAAPRESRDQPERREHRGRDRYPRGDRRSRGSDYNKGYRDRRPPRGGDRGGRNPHYDKRSRPAPGGHGPRGEDRAGRAAAGLALARRIRWRGGA